MKGYSKPLILIIIITLLLITTGSSQINLSRKGKGNQKVSKTSKTPISIDSLNNKDANINLSSATKFSSSKGVIDSSFTNANIPESTDSILNYFLNLTKGKQLYTFTTLKNRTTYKTTYELSNVFLKHAELVSDFILRYKNQKDSSEKVFNTPQLKNIYYKIKALEKIYYKNRDKLDISKIFLLISSLKASSEKVDLYLKCADLVIDNKTYYEDIPAFCDTASKYAVSVENLYDQAKAYILIGDFASYYKIPLEAIKMYYLAREAISNSNISEKQKNYEQGVLCDKLGSIFYSQNSLQATEKAGEYYGKAGEYYILAEKYHDAELVEMFKLDIATSLWDNYYHYNPNKYSLELQNKCLNALKLWFTDEYSRAISTDNDVCYIGFYSIATYLYSVDKKAALLFYIKALPYALFNLNLDRILFGLNNVSSAYAVIGNEKLSLKYSDLETLIADSLNYHFEYDQSVLNKAQNYFSLKKYDSAVFYCNTFISDTVKKNYYYPTYYSNLLEDAYRIKFISLDSLGKGDSARVYEQQYTRYQGNHYYDLVNLIYTDSKSASEWSERARDKSFKIEKELENTLKYNLILKQALLDSANKLAIENKLLADKSENLRIRDSIDNAKQGLRDLVQLERERKNTETQRKVTEKEKTVKKSIIIGAILGGLVLFSIIIIGRRYFKLRIRERETKLQLKESEIKRIDDLAQNKIHNIENDYSEIGVLLNSNQIEKLKQYNEEYESFLAAFLGNWKSDSVITLENEMVATLRYCKVKAVLRANFKYNIDSSINEPSKIVFLQSVFDTLLDNSIRHNSMQLERGLLFNVKISKEDNFIRCVVFDDGTPPATNSVYLMKENSGLNLLKSRIKNFYSELNREAPKNFFTVNALRDNRGTEVTITLPYEEI